ncbi:MAG: hypothetical protein ACOCSD_00345 [Halolamina sp.]
MSSRPNSRRSSARRRDAGGRGGLPLYTFAADEQPGDANGQGANDVWWVLGPDGSVRRGDDGTETPTEA